MSTIGLCLKALGLSNRSGTVESMTIVCKEAFARAPIQRGSAYLACRNFVFLLLCSMTADGSNIRFNLAHSAHYINQKRRREKLTG